MDTVRRRQIDDASFQSVVSAACGKVVADNRYSLALLRSVDCVLEELQRTSSSLDDVRRRLEDALIDLRKTPGKRVLDETGDLLGQIESAQQSGRAYICWLEDGLQGVHHDRQLHGHLETQVCGEFESAIRAAKRLYNVFEKVRLFVLDHDDQFEEPSGVSFDSAAALREYLETDTGT